MQIRRTATALTSAAALGLTGIAVATPAQAQPIVTGGLVNVVVVDAVDVVLQDVNVGVAAALALAANVCDVNVNVLATQLGDGDATCENAVNGTSATIDQV